MQRKAVAAAHILTQHQECQIKDQSYFYQTVSLEGFSSQLLHTNISLKTGGFKAKTNREKRKKNRKDSELCLLYSKPWDAEKDLQ